MLFYAKRFVWIELLATFFLGGIGYVGIRHFDLAFPVSVTWTGVVQALGTFFLITGWTFTVQKGYGLVKGEDYAEKLTESLARYYTDSSLIQAIAGGLTAALGEEVFFRGFVQGKWGLIASSLAFGFAHFGPKDIRAVSSWSFIHGLFFGLSYYFTGNLFVPMLAHGLFDLGGILYFQRLMRRKPA